MENLPQIDPRKKELFEARFLIQKKSGGSSNPVSTGSINKVSNWF